MSGGAEPAGAAEAELYLDGRVTLTDTLRLLDLFSGIGGFSLGLERSGAFDTVAFCEIDAGCRATLAAYWPGIKIYDDVLQLSAARLAADGIAVDAICGGFPCTDISVAGKGTGIDGPQSGLWRDYARLIGELRPRYAIIENVSALLGRGLDQVLCDLAAIGYDAEWHCIPASAIGAPHRRDRLWIIAYPDGGRGRADIAGRHNADGSDAGRAQADGVSGEISEHGFAGHLAAAIAAHCDGTGCNSNSLLTGTLQTGFAAAADKGGGSHWQTPWPCMLEALRRVDDGLPGRLDKAGLGQLGNAVVPQIPQLIGSAIGAHRAAAAGWTGARHGR